MEVITRDRCGIYAEAAEQGAAHAVQVADRFHLFLNLSTAIERSLEERSRELCLPDPAPEQPAVEVAPPSKRRTTLEEQRKQQRRQRRQERYERFELHRQGHTQLAISLELGIQRKTIRRWLSAGQFPERKPADRPHAAMSASSMSIYSNAGIRAAITRLACFRRSGRADTAASRQMVSHHVSSWRASILISRSLDRRRE